MTNGGWDFQVKRVDLDGLGIDAGQKLGMIIVQPEYDLLRDGQVPYQIAGEYREIQKGLIEKAFQIRATESQERNVAIPFVLFPEAALPVSDPDGLDCLHQQMQQAEGEVIFIGGLEGLSPQDARGVARTFAPGVDAARPAFAAGAFVNVCVIVVKSADGRLVWHFQAKLRPSRWEQQRNMANGLQVLYFVAPRVAFLCQICFDHIVAQGEAPLNAALCNQLIESTRPNAATLDFVFVPQFNPQPHHESVRQNTDFLLNYQDRGLKNDMATVVAINKAASVQEPSEYGRSGFHYRAGRWQVPISDVGPKGYQLYESDHVTSAVFRKRTQAIHVATWVPPSLNIGDPGNPRQPLENPQSYFIMEGCDPSPCSCLPGNTSAAGAFVVCDCLPCKLRDTLFLNLPAEDPRNRWQASEALQTEILKANYQDIRKHMLALSCARVGELLDLLLLEYEDKEKKANPDTWMEPRPSAVVELTAALCVLREWRQPLTVDTRKEWTALLGDFALVVLDGEDSKHYWSTLVSGYRKAFEGRYYRPEMRERAVLLVALRSSGQVEPVVSHLDFAEPRNRALLENGKSFTEPKRPLFWVCQGSLLEQARIARSIKDFMESKMGCIHG